MQLLKKSDLKNNSVDKKSYWKGKQNLKHAN